MSKHTPVLQCAACGHENEPERVYCHNCGQKLDRSILPKIEQTGGESDAQRRRRVKKMMSVRRGALGKDVKTLISVLVFAALVAAMFLFWQTPEGVPAKNPEPPIRSAADIWEALMNDKRALSADLPANDVNYYLKDALKAAESSIPGVKFERAFVTFEPGLVTVTSQRSAWGLPMYSSTTFAPRNIDGSVKWDVVGVRFGRLGVYPTIPYAPGLGLGNLKNVLSKYVAQLDRLQHVEVRQGGIRLVTKPAP